MVYWIIKCSIVQETRAAKKREVKAAEFKRKHEEHETRKHLQEYTSCTAESDDLTEAITTVSSAASTQMSTLRISPSMGSSFDSDLDGAEAEQQQQSVVVCSWDTPIDNSSNGSSTNHERDFCLEV
jgi:hypothetical protein